MGLRRAGKGYVLGVAGSHHFGSWGNKPPIAGAADEIAKGLDAAIALSWNRQQIGHPQALLLVCQKRPLPATAMEDGRWPTAARSTALRDSLAAAKTVANRRPSRVLSRDRTIQAA